MRERWKIPFLLSTSLLLPIYAIAQMDSSPHKIQLVTVEQVFGLKFWVGCGGCAHHLSPHGDNTLKNGAGVSSLTPEI